jgi:hypothetical protein
MALTNELAFLGTRLNSTGTHTEVQYSLMTFGIPVDSLPVTYEGELKTSNHTKWVARREAKDSNMMCSGRHEGIDLPCHNDVLLGRGKPYQDHPGNVRMRHLVETYVGDYKSSKVLGQKTLLAAKVVASIKQDSCRFLKRNAVGWWLEVPDEEAAVKVLKTFKTALPSFSSQDGGSRYAASDNSKRAKV